MLIQNIIDLKSHKDHEEIVPNLIWMTNQLGREWFLNPQITRQYNICIAWNKKQIDLVVQSI